MSVAELIPIPSKLTGPRCKAIRLRFEVKQSAVAARAGCTLTGLARWETGRYGAPGKWPYAEAVHDALLGLCIDGCDRLRARLVKKQTEFDAARIARPRAAPR